MCRKRSAELLGRTTSTFPLVTYADSSIFVSRSGAFIQEREVMRHAGLVLGALRHVLTALLPGIDKAGLGFVARNQTMVVQTASKPNPSGPARQQLLSNTTLGYVSTCYHIMTVSTISEFNSRHTQNTHRGAASVTL